MRKEEPNPYLEASLRARARACRECADELDQRSQWTRQQKEAFATRLRQLLIAVSSTMSTNDTMPGSPELRSSRGAKPSITEEFMKWHDGEREVAIRDARKMTLVRAAKFALGDKASYWLSPPGAPWRARPEVICVDSDEALAEQLRALEAVWRARNHEKTS